MSKNIVLASLFALVLVSGVLYYNDFFEDRDITANVIKDTSEQELRELRKELVQVKADKLEEELREIILEREEESQIEEESKGPHAVASYEENLYELEYETFDVIKGNRDLEKAVILYDLEPSDIRHPIENGELTLINFHPDMTYKGYGELKDFLNDLEIESLVMYSSEINSATNIRKGTGVSVMMLMGEDDGNGGMNIITN